MSKKELEKLLNKVDVLFTDGTKENISSFFDHIQVRISSLERYLNIHYEENTTKGYVKNKKK